MSKAKTRRTRRKRRLNNMRMRTGKRIVTHKLRGGRTGQVYFKNRKERSV